MQDQCKDVTHRALVSFFVMTVRCMFANGEMNAIVMLLQGLEVAEK